MGIGIAQRTQKVMTGILGTAYKVAPRLVPAMGILSAGALGAAQVNCGGRNIYEGSPCTYTPATSSTEEMQAKFDVAAAMSFEANGNISTMIEITVQDMNSAPFNEYATFSYKIGTNNKTLCIDGSGNYSKSAADCAPCTDSLINSCYPAHDAESNVFPGLIPIGYPKLNADGAKMLQEFNGSRWAAYSQLFDRDFAERVWRYDYVDQGTNNPATVLLGRGHRVKWNNGEATDYYAWYQVDPDKFTCVGGASTDSTGQPVCGTDDKVEVNGAKVNDDNKNVYDKANNQILLPPMNVLYLTDANGAYSVTEEVNGQKLPKPDRSLENLLWTVPVVADPNMQALYFGKSDGNTGFTPWGILMDENRKVDYSRIAQYGRNMVATKMEIINGYGNDVETVSLTNPLSDINGPGAITGLIPPRFFAWMDPNFKMRLYISDPKDAKPDWQNMLEWARSAGVAINLTVTQDIPGVCQ